MSKRFPFASRRPRRFTARAQLAFWYALVMVLCGGALLAMVSLFIGYVPDYGFEVAGPNHTEEPLVIAVDDPSVLDSEVRIAVDNRGDFLSLLLNVSIVSLLVLVVFSAVAAWLLAGRMLKPLTAVNRAAKLAAEGKLDHRVGISGPNDEITELAETFDQMLENIERSVAAQRRFAANASHELRTPLAATRTMLDVALSKPGPIDRSVLLKLQEVNERSIRTVESLLDLAELEAGTAKPVDCDLAAIVATVLDESQDAIAERGLRVDSRLAPTPAFGDERLYHQLAQNLILNAIQHNVDGGEIEIETRVIAGDLLRCELRVRNSGEPIASAQIEQLTEPFKTTKGRTGGANRGLGLSIVQAIVEHSHGALAIEPNDDGGLQITVTLPTAK